MINSSNNSQDFDINITPIIDCFTVLVTFLLASSAFISIGLLDAGIAAGGAQAATQTDKKQSIQLTLKLKSNLSMDLKMSGQRSETLHSNAVNGTRQYEAFVKHLAGLQTQGLQMDALIVEAEEDVPYGEVVLAMDQFRPVVPNIMLGGF